MNASVVRQAFVKYTALNIIASLGLSFYILADTYFIANGIGAEGLAGLNIALPVFNFINGFGLMFGIGGATKFSIAYGLTGREETDKIYTNAFIGMLRVAVIFEILGLFFSKPLTRLLGADDTVFELTHEYIKMILRFSPAFLMNNVMLCFMRNDKAPKLAAAGMLCGSATNVILDYIYIYPMQMGMKGAALATCTAPFVSMAVMNIHIITGWNAFTLRFQKPSHELIREITRLGIPSLVTEIASGVVIMVFNVLILNINGSDGVASYGIVANIAVIVTAIYTGIAQGVQPLMSGYHGLKDRISVNRLLKYSIVMAFSFSLILYICIFIKAPEITALFNGENNDNLQSMAEIGMRLYFIALPFMGVNIVLSTLFTSTENPEPAQKISFYRGIVFVIPTAFFMCAIMGMNGIMLTVPVAEFTTFVYGIYCFVKIISELNKVKSIFVKKGG